MAMALVSIAYLGGNSRKQTWGKRTKKKKKTERKRGLAAGRDRDSGFWRNLLRSEWDVFQNCLAGS
jgi:hypothetical protein